jgi:opacity protein-like surface antigen
MRRLLLGTLGLLFAAPFAFSGDLFSFGIKGGVPLNDAFNTVTMGDVSYLTNTKRFVVGPEFDINLPAGFAVEVDALYRRLDFESSSNLVDRVEHQATTANAWDIPLLLKWRFAPMGPVRPYVGGGPTFRGLTNIHQVANFFGVGPATTTTTSSPSELNDRFVTGFTAVAGLQLFKHVAPEIRYTRWGWDAFSSPGTAFRSNPDQWDFMLGLTF